ncbi:hypothetical protein EB796_003392 [Bugula neritina]|uniref:BRICHOS domain-containing protein n=1 Tax=Bugula neritina TaxID=10212 RepID=A0A7J7KK96_BUGNE|nr:hypothetical protein EB796_003392 [Bugula neritina]
MDSKDLKHEENKSQVTGRWQVLAMITLILAVLLTTTVGVIMYIALNPTAGCTEKLTGPPDYEETIHVTNKPDVQLAFNSKENIAVLTTTDGGFDFEDYGKGVHITKDTNSGICYLLPSIVSAADSQILRRHFQGQQVNVTAESHLTSVTVHPGKVSDMSFIPAEAKSFCFNGYQWVTIYQEKPSSSHEIAKRGIKWPKIKITITITINF